MTAIVCVDKNWAIGRENRLLFRISADLKHFRALTTGKTVVMGKNTLLSLPGAKPLPDRRNLVVSTTMAPREGVEIARSVVEAAAPDWTVETVGEWQEENGLRFRYVDYVRRT